MLKDSIARRFLWPSQFKRARVGNVESGRIFNVTSRRLDAIENLHFFYRREPVIPAPSGRQREARPCGMYEPSQLIVLTEM